MESNDEKQVSRINTNPSKNFFVHMLTRDIALPDAILDLVDNSIDGVIRLTKDSENDAGAVKVFEGYGVDIVFGDDRFEISDNCGGIDEDTALNYAFRFGREADDDRDDDAKTIGMYGIGMKRAIFKIGAKAEIETWNDTPLTVTIPDGWESTPDWKLPVERRAEVEKGSTRIVVEKLRPGVRKTFFGESFAVDLHKEISRHYSRFIERGFSISINGEKVEPHPIKIFWQDPSGNEEPSIRPYVYFEKTENLEIRIVFGFNSPPKGLEGDDEGKDIDESRSEDDAGWTILCNDRAVLYNDKTMLTGWGDGAPKYHPQFSILSGVVEFNSTKVDELPITTTKRGVDTSSHAYITTKKLMREAMKRFTSYTNKWKNEPRSEQRPFFENAEKLEIDEIFRKVEQSDLHSTKKHGGGREYNPKLPKHPGSRPDVRRIVFSKKLSDIRTLSEYLFGFPDKEPKEVGEEAFDRMLRFSKEMA